MDPYSWLCLSVCFVLVFFSAYFSATESAFAGMNRIRMRSLADGGDRRAKAALRISENFDKALTALLIGNNVVNILCASLATVFALDVFTNGVQSGVDPLLTTMTTVVTTVAIFMFGEMIPKSLANADNDRMARLLAPSFRIYMTVMTPLTVIFYGINRLVHRLTGDAAEPTVTEDELSTIIEAVEEEGVIDEEQGELLQSALEFSSTTVADVLTLWDDVTKLSLDMTPEEVYEVVRTSKHSRLPVLDGEEVVGILMIRSYLKTYIATGRADIRNLMSPPAFVALDAVIDGLLEQMSRSKCYLSVVLDKNGKPIGVVTIEDFLEELVGEIFDEDDEVNPDFMKLGGNYFEVSGALTMGQLLSEIGCEAEEPVPAAKPLHIWLIERLGHTPEEGETLVFGGLTFEIETVTDGRVERVTVKLETPELEIETPDEEGKEEEQA